MQILYRKVAFGLFLQLLMLVTRSGGAFRSGSRLDVFTSIHAASVKASLMPLPLHQSHFSIYYSRPKQPSTGLHSSSSSSDNENDDAEESQNATRSSSTQVDALTQSYRTCQYGLAAMGTILFFMPDRTMTVLLAAKMGGAAGFGIAAGLCFILAGAHQHHRLGSDTYKRLNVGLLGFSVMGLAAFPGEAGFSKHAGPAIVGSVVMLVLKAMTARVAWTGWKTGIQPKEGSSSKPKLLEEFFRGSKATMKGLKVQDRKKSLTYRNIVLLLGLGVLSAFMDGIFNIRYMKRFERSWFDVSLKWSAMARLFMISTMVFSLKDAAERDRLTGTTFIQLNLMIGTWAILVGLGQSIYPLGFEAYRGVEMYALAIPFFLRAYTAQKKKSEKKLIS